MSKRVDTRINDIKSGREDLLKQVRENLLSSCSNYAEYLDTITGALASSEESKKKYDVYTKAKDMITSLAQDVINAKTYEEMIALRNRINYYINKIKNEIKNRNIDATTLGEYQSKAKNIRDELTRTVRIFRRSANIDEIDSLYSKLDSLNEDELKKLKGLLQRERRFNTNFFKERKRTTKKEEEKEELPSESIDEERFTGGKLSAALKAAIDETLRTAYGEEVLPNFGLNSTEHGEESPSSSSPNLEIANPTGGGSPMDPEVAALAAELERGLEEKQEGTKYEFVKVAATDFDTVSGPIAMKTNAIIDRYKLKKTKDYSGKRIKDIGLLLVNIPHIIHNNKASKRMNFDYCTYGSDPYLAGIMEYQSRRCSVKGALKSIFSKSHLQSKGLEYLQKGEDIYRWIYEFLKSNDESIYVPKQYQKAS